jgi:hypothetical protein
MDEKLRPGDVIQVNGPTVPQELRDKWFFIEKITRDGSLELSQPYHDPQCAQPYVPLKQGRKGSIH